MLAPAAALVPASHASHALAPPSVAHWHDMACNFNLFGVTRGAFRLKRSL